MKLTEHEGDGSPLNALAERTAYLSVAPLVLCLAGVGLWPEAAGRELAQRSAVAWGAAWLSFTAAVHWGLALAGRLPWEPARAVAALLPLLVATLAMLVGGQHGLALLVVGVGGFWLYEHRALGAQLSPAYLNLRRQLSFATCALLALTMFASDRAGLA